MKLPENESSRITELKEEIKELRQKLSQKYTPRYQSSVNEHELFEGIVDNIPVMITIYDPGLNNFRLNKALKDITGWTEEDAADGNLLAKVYPDPEYRQSVIEYMRSLQPGWKELVMTAKNGARIDSSWANINLHSGVQIGIGIDIRERKKANALQGENEQRLQGLFSNAAIGIVITDSEDCIIDVNNHLCEILGFHREELLGRRIIELTAPEDRSISDSVNSMLHHGEAKTIDYEKRYLKKDGSVLWVHVTTSTVLDHSGKHINSIRTVEDISARKEAEERMRESEARFRAVFQVTTEGIIIFDSNGEAIYVNEAEARLNGFQSTDEMMRRLDYFGKFFEITELDGRFVAYDNWPVSKALRGESVRNWEVRVRRNDINEEWFFNFNAEPVFDENNKLLQAVLFTRNVTDRRKAEEALRRNRQELKSITDNSPDVIARFDRQLKHTFINPYGEKVYGKKRDEIIGKTNAELGMPEDKVAFWKQHFEEAFRTGNEQTVEFEFESPTFGLQYLLSVFVPEKDDKGDVASILAITRDITSRKAAEEAVKESEEMFSNMVHALPIGMALANYSDRTIYKVNPAWLNITGYSTEEEVLGKTAEQLEIMRDRETQKQYLDEFRKKGRIRNFEASIFTKTGIQRIVSLNLDQVHINGRKYMLASIEDITEQKILEKELKQKNEELTQFIYTVSHDLKSPLVTIKSFTSYLQEDIEQQDKESQARDIGYIVNAADKMGRLLDELLELSRIGKKENPKSEIPMKTVARSAIDLVAGRISQLGVNVSITGPNVMLFGLQQRLVQLYQNLIDNAVKFMGSQKSPLIEIGSYVDPTKNKVVLFVRDNGSGIDPKYHHKVFGLFEKLDNKAEGSGIGLALIKRIVEVHGGEIWLASDGLGKGTTFYFTLDKSRILGY